MVLPWNTWTVTAKMLSATHIMTSKCTWAPRFQRRTVRRCADIRPLLDARRGVGIRTGQATYNFLCDVEDAGGWRRYVDEPRVQLALLRVLCVQGRATAPEHSVFASTLPLDCFWHVLTFWRGPLDY